MTEQEFRRRVAEAYGSQLSSSGALRATAAAALAAAEDGASRSFRPARWFEVGSAILIAALVVATMLAVGALHHSATPAPSAPYPVSPPPQTPIAALRVTWGQAQADSPSALLVPRWLPFDNYRPSKVEELKGPDGRAIDTITEYSSSDGRSVIIDQYHQPSFIVEVPSPSKPGTIGAQPATFYEYVDGSPTAVTWKLPDGNYVAITTSGLTAAEMTRVANSLHS